MVTTKTETTLTFESFDFIHHIPDLTGVKKYKARI